MSDRVSTPRRKLRAEQASKLASLLGVLRENRFYGPRLEGLVARGPAHADAAHRLESWLERLPFTTKAELAEDQAAFPPYGSIPAEPLDRYRYVHQTSGTTGRALYWLDDEDGWATWLRCWERVYEGAGVTSRDVVFCAFSFGPYVAHWTALAGARAIGALGLAGSGLSTEQRLERLLEHEATVLVSTPTYALHLAEVAESLGVDLKSGSIRTTIQAGEPGASVPATKDRLEACWGARSFDHVGATEVGAWGFACQQERFGVHLNEREFVFEVIDPSSGEAVADGERGELVVTTLSRNGMPVLRYRTGDVVVRSPEPCGCGRGEAWIVGGVIGRTDDRLIVRGVNVYPSAVEDLIRRQAEVVEYEVEVRRVGELDELLVKVELAPGADADAVAELAGRFRRGMGIRVPIEVVAADSLPRYELKARRFKRVN